MPKMTKHRPTKRVNKRKKTTGAIARIGDLWDDEEDWIRINLYGRSGTGKTTLWGTFPKPVLALVCSGPTKPGELRSIKIPEYKGKIKRLVLKSSDEIGEVVEHQQETNTFKTVVLDHASGLQELILKEVLGLEELPAQLSWGLASRQQYGQVGLQMKERLRSLLNLDCHCVIIAQERVFNSRDEDASDEGEEIIAPFVASALTPSVTDWLNYSCDYICQTIIRPKTVVKEFTVGKGNKAKKKRKTVRVRGEVDYCLRVAPSEVFASKFRIPKGVKRDQFIKDPTYEKIKALIDGAGQ